MSSLVSWSGECHARGSFTASGARVHRGHVNIVISGLMMMVAMMTRFNIIMGSSVVVIIVTVMTDDLKITSLKLRPRSDPTPASPVSSRS